jgi:hypothetical protein
MILATQETDSRRMRFEASPERWSLGDPISKKQKPKNHTQNK